MHVARDLTVLRQFVRGKDRAVAGQSMPDLLHGLAEKITRAPGRRAEQARILVANPRTRRLLQLLLRSERSRSGSVGGWLGTRGRPLPGSSTRSGAGTVGRAWRTTRPGTPRTGS